MFYSDVFFLVPGIRSWTPNPIMLFFYGMPQYLDSIFADVMV